MRKIFAWSLFLIVFLVASGASLAVMPDKKHVSNTKSNNKKPLVIPDTAIQVAPHVFSLGSSTDPGTGKVVEGYLLVHSKRENVKNQGKKSNGTSACYGFVANGAKWQTVEPWLVNATNSSSIPASDIMGLLQSGITKWEDATDGVVNGLAAVDILGDGSLTIDTLVADAASPDNKNEVYFGAITDSNTVAVTIIWGIFGGPSASRQLVEWDIIFDDTKSSWSVTGDANAMDFESIATHELGHAVGLADLHTACVDETMYGYSTNGETKKRDLNAGDIQGINTLY